MSTLSVMRLIKSVIVLAFGLAAGFEVGCHASTASATCQKPLPPGTGGSDQGGKVQTGSPEMGSFLGAGADDGKDVCLPPPHQQGK